jgi:hypothetical protein
MAESLLVRKAGGGGAKITGVEVDLVASSTVAAGDFVEYNPYEINSIQFLPVSTFGQLRGTSKVDGWDIKKYNNYFISLSQATTGNTIFNVTRHQIKKNINGKLEEGESQLKQFTFDFSVDGGNLRLLKNDKNAGFVLSVGSAYHMYDVRLPDTVFDVPEYIRQVLSSTTGNRLGTFEIDSSSNLNLIPRFTTGGSIQFSTFSVAGRVSADYSLSTNNLTGIGQAQKYVVRALKNNRNIGTQHFFSMIAIDGLGTSATLYRRNGMVDSGQTTSFSTNWTQIETFEGSATLLGLPALEFIQSSINDVNGYYAVVTDNKTKLSLRKTDTSLNTIKTTILDDISSSIEMRPYILDLTPNVFGTLLTDTDTVLYNQRKIVTWITNVGGSTKIKVALLNANDDVISIAEYNHGSSIIQRVLPIRYDDDTVAIFFTDSSFNVYWLATLKLISRVRTSKKHSKVVGVASTGGTAGQTIKVIRNV